MRHPSGSGKGVAVVCARFSRMFTFVNSYVYRVSGRRKNMVNKVFNSLEVNDER